MHNVLKTNRKEKQTRLEESMIVNLRCGKKQNHLYKKKIKNVPIYPLALNHLHCIDSQDHYEGKH